MTDDEKVEALAQVIQPTLATEATNETWRTYARRLLAAPNIHITIDPAPHPAEQIAAAWVWPPFEVDSDRNLMAMALRQLLDDGVILPGPNLGGAA